ncbi:hypothetical protein BDV93DRAFT_576187 [Ceratobasidium sp. AG-I]|nr:hypothetical protein BDV93DRAFT_576187 [Ceratobasidium sp. AG-I]
MFSRAALFSAVCGTLVFGVSAQTTVWNQCGGFSFPGDKNCVEGTVCYKWNDYYSQCIPIASVPSTTTYHAPTPTVPATQHWFSFGDSYTQTGFDINGAKPSAENPIGNPQYPGYTACGMVPNWVDFITTKHNRTKLLTYNFAYGGATIDAKLVKPYTDTVQSLTDQVNTFLDNTAVAPWVPSDTLFSIWIGINDIGNSFWLEGDRDAFSDTLLDAYFALVEKLYNAGGRNFLFVNVPHVNRSPLMMAQPESSRIAEEAVIDGFNAKLADRVDLFDASHTGIKSWVLYPNNWIDGLLDNPTLYGFKDNTSYGDAADLMWCNDYHISSKVHESFANYVAIQLWGLFTG